MSACMQNYSRKNVRIRVGYWGFPDQTFFMSFDKQASDRKIQQLTIYEFARRTESSENIRVTGHFKGQITAIYFRGRNPPYGEIEKY